MDEVLERLKTTASNCADAYSAWSGNKKDNDKREALQNAVHELRKVSSRLEIEIAVSERDEQSKRPIPIPPHRASKNKGGKNNKTSDVQNAEDNGDLPDFIKSKEKSSSATKGKLRSRSKPSKKSDDNSEE